MKKRPIADRNHKPSLPQNTWMEQKLENMMPHSNAGTNFQRTYDRNPSPGVQDERDMDFNSNLNYRPKAEVDKSSNRKPLNTRSHVMKTNVKNQGWKDYHDEGDIPNLDNEANEL